MKIAFYASNIVPIHAGTLNERPLGGTETGLIRLAEALSQLGHEIFVYTPLESPPPSKPTYLFKNEIVNASELDAFVAVRDWIPLLFQEIRAKAKYYWTGDAADQFPNYGIGDKRVAAEVKNLLTVSQWQSENLCKGSGFPLEKAAVIGNGVDLSLFEGSEKRVRKRLIYSSMPYRGLVHIPPLYQALKKKHPDLELHVFSGYKVYDQNEKEFETLRKALQALPHCTIHGNVLQKDLAREFMKSSILFYPSHFEETSCITAIEAQAAGCPVLTTRLAALPETIGEAGILIDEVPGSQIFYEKFFAEADRLLSDDTLWTRLSEAGKSRASGFSWKVVAERFIEVLKRA